MRYLTATLLSIGFAAAASAGVTSKAIEYDAAGTKCKGMLYMPDDAKGPLPGVIVFHEWWGLNDHAKQQAEKLAKAGYVALCADMYGDGKVTEHPSEAKKFAGAVRENQKAWLARSEAALKTLQSQDGVDKTKIAAIGYCFGGTTAILLAASGAEVKAVTAFHAGLPDLKPEQAKAIKGRLLICHGGADTFIPEETIKKFRGALDDAKVKYEFISYPGVTHSFTVPDVDKKLPGLKYDADADKKSWESMMALFKETLK